MKTLAATTLTNTSMTAPCRIKLKRKSPLAALCVALIAITAPSLHADDVYWASNSGTWFTPDGWLDDRPPAGNPRNAPEAADEVHIISGTVDIGLDVSATTAAATMGESSGEFSSVNLDGTWRNTGKIVVGSLGKGVFEIAPTGTLITNILYAGDHAGSEATITVAGFWQSNAVTIGNAGTASLDLLPGSLMQASGNLTVGSVYDGTGILNVHEDAVLYFPKKSALILGSADTASGTAIISGTVLNAGTVYISNHSTSDSTLIINEGGYLKNTANSWFARNANKDLSLVNGTNSAYIAGTWDTGGYFVLGANAGHSILDIAATGTLIVRTTGIRITYYHPDSTAYVNVDGYMEAAGSCYIIVAHYGDSYMRVGVTGTVIAGGYISIGQGDSNASYPPNPLTASGTVDVFGYMEAGNYLRVANRLTGVLNLASSGTIKVKKYFAVSENNGIASTGTATIAGRLDVGTDIILGHYSMNTGYLDVKTTSNVTAGGNYRQNNLSTLSVELETDRIADTVNPNITAPLVSANGAATLSGTLYAYGAAIDTIPEFSWDQNGEAKASTLTGIPILRANGGITGDFDVVEIEGLTIPASLPDFIRGGGLKVNEGGPVDTRYDIGYGLAWRSGISSAHGTFTVEEGKTFDVDIQLSDRPGLTFESGWDGKSLVKEGPGTLILSIANAYTGATTVESGTLRFTGPVEHKLGALINNGTIDFYATDAEGRIGGYRTIRASSLAGDGTYRMGLDLSTGASDRLVIDGDATGTHRLLITGQGATPTGDEPMPTLVTIGGVNDIEFSAGGEIVTGTTSFTFEGNFDYGLFNYEVQMLGNKIVIVNTGLTPAAFEPIRGVPGAQSVLWFSQQDNVSRRLGELRATPQSGAGFDIWARGHASQASIGGGSTEMRLSDVDLWGAEIGSDYTWKFDDQRATVGVFVGTGNASQDFKNIANASKSTGESDMLGVGVYGAWLAAPGWFLNTMATLAQYKNSFDVADISNNRTTGDYKDRGYGVTAEGGRRFAIAASGWFVEPAIRGAVARLTRADYETKGNNKLNVHGSDVTVTRLRGIMRIGRAWNAGRAGSMEIAGHFGASRERSSGGDVTISSSSHWRPNLDGNRYEAGIDFFWQPHEFSQIYFDYEYAAGDNYEKPWGISLGFRLSL